MCLFSLFSLEGILLIGLQFTKCPDWKSSPSIRYDMSWNWLLIFLIYFLNNFQWTCSTVFAEFNSFVRSRKQIFFCCVQPAFALYGSFLAWWQICLSRNRILTHMKLVTRFVLQHTDPQPQIMPLRTNCDRDI